MKRWVILLISFAVAACGNNDRTSHLACYSGGKIIFDERVTGLTLFSSNIYKVYRLGEKDPTYVNGNCVITYDVKDN